LARHAAAYQRALDGLPGIDPDGVDQPPTIVPVTEVALIRQERLLAPHWLYRWTTAAVATIGAPPSSSAGHQDERLRQQLDL
jgi:hypothetical protein